MKFKELIFNNRYLFVFLILSIAISNFQDWYLLTPRKELSKTHSNILKKLGKLPIEQLDIPISSIVVYKGKIIGEGYNTVLKDNNAGGHAEINAISNVLNKIGHDEFSKLNRDSITIISTYEPCLMCKGAIINHGIKNTYFIEKKSTKHHLSTSYKSLKYEMKKRKIKEDTLQQYLFELHPHYQKVK